MASSQADHPIRIRSSYNAFGYLKLLYEPRESSTNPLDADDPANDHEYWSAIAENQYGDPAFEHFGNGMLTERVYEEDTGRLQELTTTISGGSTPQSFTYTYYADGNLETRTNAVDSEVTHYTYDELDRLTDATSSLGANPPHFRESYTYDPDGTGNITTRTYGDPSAGPLSTLTYNYDAPGHPYTLTSLTSGTAGQLWYYDANGNLETRVSEASGVLPDPLIISYNRLRMPASVANSEGEVEFLYDASGMRSRKRRADGSAQTFYLDGAYERSSLGGVSGYTERVLVKVGDRAVAEVTRDPSGTQQKSYLHGDRLGSIQAITDEAGQVIERRKYEAFGKRREVSPSATDPTHRDFTGHELDGELGLVNMKARLYDPQVGRFLAADPIIAEPQWSQGLNPYSYVDNGPVNAVDPTGLFEICLGLCYDSDKGITGVGIGYRGDDGTTIGYAVSSNGVWVGVQFGSGGLLDDNSGLLRHDNLASSPKDDDILGAPGFGSGLLQDDSGSGSKGSQQCDGLNPLCNPTVRNIIEAAGIAAAAGGLLVGLVKALSGHPDAEGDGEPTAKVRAVKKNNGPNTTGPGSTHPEVAFGFSATGQMALPWGPNGQLGYNAELATNGQTGIYQVESPDAQAGGGLLAGFGVSANFAFGESGAVWTGQFDNFEVATPAFSISFFWSPGDGPGYYGIDISPPGAGYGLGAGRFYSNYAPTWNTDIAAKWFSEHF